MLRVRQVKLEYNLDNNEELVEKIAKKLKIKVTDIVDYKINKKSLDARRKDKLYYVYEVDVSIKNEDKVFIHNKSNDVVKTPREEYNFKVTGDKFLRFRPVIIGSGPAGLFTAYALAENGFHPLIIERGEDMDTRVKTVNEFWQTGKLNLNSNVQFGEGGAGTFSDGKLNTLVKDKSFRMKKVFDTFVLNGAPEETLYLNKPHIGTDILRDVVKNLRNKIIKMGGEFRYNSKLEDIIIKNDRVVGIKVNGEIIDCEVLVLAVGHSARDTFKMLYDKGLNMESKPFAVGVRIQHPQKMINKAQYGIADLTASYKLTSNINGRGVYTFCMCPGGYVVNASSEDDELAINGMSYHDRASDNANSAIVVSVSSKDYGEGVLAGMEFQRSLEQKAYKWGKGRIPVQLFKDFKEGTLSKEFGRVKPLFKGEYEMALVNEILPNDIYKCLKEAILYFDTKINGFGDDEVIIAGIESRTSSPVRIIRDDSCESNIKGIYPCGEGAGYAGGITTSAMDGLKVAEEIAKIYGGEYE